MIKGNARELADKYITKLIERGRFDGGDIEKVASEWQKLMEAFEKMRD